MPVSIGHITVDEEVVSKQLKNDFKDDWFPDPIGYNDYFDGGLLSEIIAKNFSDNHGSYLPGKALLLNVPKANFTLRYALETSVTDRAVYHALAAKLLPLYDPCISWRVFSHRRDVGAILSESTRSDVKYTFRNGVNAWSDFLGCVESKLLPGTFLLSTDLANYFENINLKNLHQAMIDLVPLLDCDPATKSLARSQADQLFAYLSKWTFTEDKGLPQNRDASSFLANIYMRSVDCAMIEQGFEYFRYMDDIKIVCPDEGSARRALKSLVLALRPVGQFVNSGKTSIISASNKEELKRYLGSGSLEMKRIDSAWRTKSLKPITRTFVPLKNLALKTLDSGGYDSKEFRYCISRLETLARCHEFNVPGSYFSEITPLVIDGLEKAPVATDQICRYLRALDLNPSQLDAIFHHLVDANHSIYNWKNYRLWVLLAQKTFQADKARILAREMIRTRGDDPTRAGATIFLGASGDENDRAFIAANFHTLSSFLGQRAAIIGAQEVHFAPRKTGGVSIRDHVGPHVRKDLQGSYKALRRAGKYVLPLEPVSISRFVDLERDYD